MKSYSEPRATNSPPVVPTRAMSPTVSGNQTAQPLPTTQGRLPLAFLMFLLANAALFVRPAELFPALGDVQLYLAFILAAMIAGLKPIQTQLRKRTLYQQPVNLCMVGLVVAVALSHLTSGSLNLAADGVNMMLRILVYYLLCVGNLTSIDRLRKFLFVTALCSTVMVVLSANDYFKFIQEWEGRTAEIMDAKDKDLAAESNGTPRILRHIIDSAGPVNSPEAKVRSLGLVSFSANDRTPAFRAPLAVKMSANHRILISIPPDWGPRDR